MDRKDFFSDGVKEVTRNFLRSPVGSIFDRQLHGIANLLSPETLDVISKKASQSTLKPGKSNLTADPHQEIYPRPPGALIDSEAFNKACNRCGDCIVACPHWILFSLSPESGPVLNPNLTACRLCEDWPCIESCETGALIPLEEGALPCFGTALPLHETCMNHPDRLQEQKESGRKRVIYCKECVTVCPVEGAIKLNTKTRLPQVDADICTGCGLCVSGCPVKPAALRVI